MLSLSPGTPGRRVQKPRTIRSIDTPGLRSAVEGGRLSFFHGVHLAMIRAGRPALLVFDSRLDQFQEPRLHVHRPPAALNNALDERPSDSGIAPPRHGVICGSQVQQPQVGVEGAVPAL